MKYIAVISVALAYIVSSAGCSKKPNADNNDAHDTKAEKVESKPESLNPELDVKLSSIILPMVDFQEVPLSFAIDYLRIRAMELDNIEIDPEKKGVNFVMHLTEGSQEPVIPELRLRNASLKSVLDYCCELTGMNYTVEESGVVLRANGDPWLSKINDQSVDAAVKEKADSIIIPAVMFENIILEEAVDYLRIRSIELDVNTIERDQKGVNFVIRKDKGGDEDLVIPELNLRNVPISKVLDHICEATNMQWSADEYAIVIRPAP